MNISNFFLISRDTILHDELVLQVRNLANSPQQLWVTETDLPDRYLPNCI